MGADAAACGAHGEMWRNCVTRHWLVCAHPVPLLHAAFQIAFLKCLFVVCMQAEGCETHHCALRPVAVEGAAGG